MAQCTELEDLALIQNSFRKTILEKLEKPFSAF